MLSKEKCYNYSYNYFLKYYSKQIPLDTILHDKW